MDGDFVLDDFIKIAVPPDNVDVVIGWIFGFGDDVYGLGGQEMKVGTAGGSNEQVIWWWMFWSNEFLEPLPPAAGQDDIHIAVNSLRKYAVGNINFIKYNKAIWIKIRFYLRFKV